MLFVEYLIAIRKRSDITPKELARLVGVSYNSYMLWEKGRLVPRAASAYSLDVALKLPQGSVQNWIVHSKKIRRVYVCHPLRNGRDNDQPLVMSNREKISEICNSISQQFEDILILSPIHNFIFMPTTGDQAKVFSRCRELLTVADELWLFGDHENSEGCQIEIRLAKELKIPVFYKTFLHGKIST